MASAQETRWYVSPDGRDEWSGRLPAPDAARADGPFRTLARAGAAVQPGDVCLLRQGVYRETLKPARGGEPSRPITFTSFPGENAEICGADLVDGWAPEEGRILAAPMAWDLDDQNQVFAGGVPLDEARWPKNTGTLFQPVRAAAAAGTAGTLQDPALPADRDWTGATLWCAGGDRWICWSETVTGFDPATRTLRFTMANAEHWYTVRPGSPYVLIGARAALTGDGEWWFDRARQRLLLIPPRGADPAAPAIEAKRRLHCLDLAGLSHITIDRLRFRAGGVLTDAGCRGIRLLRCAGTWVAHSWRREVGASAGVLIRGQDNAVEDCELAGSSTSVLAVEGSGHRIVNCLLRDGNYGAKWKGAVSLNGRRLLFSHNTVRHSGRDLLAIHGVMEGLIQYNDLSDAGWLTCDLGMLYGHNSDFMGTLIRRNLVHDNRAAGCAMGIYFDHCSHNAIVQENVVWNVRDDPIRINNPSHFDLVMNNSCFASGPLTTFDHAHRDDLFGVRFTGNIVNQPIRLPAHVVLERNLVSADPGYDDPAQARFTLKPGAAAGLGAFPPGRPAWRAGRDPGHPPEVAWEPAAVAWMNAIRNACFELETLEGWEATGQAAQVPGNGWGNPVHGSKTSENTGTSKQELRLGGGRARVAQEVAGLSAGVPHLLSGWLRSSAPDQPVRLGVRLPDGSESWSQAVAVPAWTRVSVAFAAGTGVHAVVVEKTGDGSGFAWCDNLGLPRAP